MKGDREMKLADLDIITVCERFGDYGTLLYRIEELRTKGEIDEAKRLLKSLGHQLIGIGSSFKEVR